LEGPSGLHGAAYHTLVIFSPPIFTGSHSFFKPRIFTNWYEVLVLENDDMVINHGHARRGEHREFLTGFTDAQDGF
jgi:hypothetical protein